MKVKDLLKALEGVDPETEVIGGAWNGRVDTYKVMDDTWYTEFDNLWSDFYGTPGEMDDRIGWYKNIHIESYGDPTIDIFSVIFQWFTDNRELGECKLSSE